MVWCETGTPDLAFAKKFAEGIRKKYPGKMLAYNCSPSFNWKRNLDDATIAKFQRELGAMGYKFQFITLAGFHSLNYSMFELAYGYARNNMSAFVELQEKEFAAAEKGFTAVKHQREVGTSYFDQITQVVHRRQGLDHGAARLDRGRAVLRRGRARPGEEDGQEARRVAGEMPRAAQAARPATSRPSTARPRQSGCRRTSPATGRNLVLFGWNHPENPRQEHRGRTRQRQNKHGKEIAWRRQPVAANEDRTDADENQEVRNGGQQPATQFQGEIRRLIDTRFAATSARTRCARCDAARRSALQGSPLSASFALSSTAGAASVTLMRSPCLPANSEREAPGWTWSSRISASSAVRGR